MKLFKFLSITALTVLFFKCGDGTSSEKILFSIDTKDIKQQYSLNESMVIAVTNSEKKVIDSVVYFSNDNKLGVVKTNQKFTYNLSEETLGIKQIVAKVYFEGSNAEASTSITIVAPNEPKLLKYTLVNTYEHDQNAYTQGLEFYNGFLFESAGQYKESSLRKTAYTTGKILEKITLEDHFFAEGITILDNKIYQLTWQEKTGFIYDATTMKKIGNFSYDTEGWGLTNDGSYLYMTDGSEHIYKLDAKTQKKIASLSVYSNQSKIENLNELEWIDGKIWANVYQMDAIAVIDPKNGAVEGILNLSDLKSKVTPHAELDVLNGIAYNQKTKTIFVTGKNWDKLFEIKIN